jgi:hypothetical protein
MADRPQDTTDPVKRTDERLAEEYARLQLEIHQQGNARLIAVDYLAGLREGRALERAELEPKLEEKCEALRDALKQNQESARVEAGLREIAESVRMNADTALGRHARMLQDIAREALDAGGGVDAAKD